MDTAFLAESWRITLLCASGNSMNDGLTHRKFAPSLIVAQAVRGCYEVTSPRGHCLAHEGECFLARTGEELLIVHHAPKRGKMQACWVHLDFRIGGGVDPFMLVDLPTKATGTIGRELGRHIVALINEKNDESNSLYESAIRVKHAYGILTSLLSISPLEHIHYSLKNEKMNLHGVLRMMHDRMSEPIGPQELADACSLSLSHFYALFGQIYGCSPLAYLKRLRLQRARQLLAVGSLPLKQIAQQTGFMNVYHFSREFKKETGLPPGEFRERYSW